MFDLDELSRWDEALERLAHADFDEDQNTRGQEADAPREVEEK
ncbi:hypothetical protein [Rhodovulum adriaticum]|uniref:Uncharacterized protein n=1 Tax=Rhodovulum adriaticum TaxID=35804 RepID=A0A4R2NZF3_RHOAD|nr:hypothetical protein [Rhodovulum adriaticum]TCP27699.1 hypothetical protein EV656_101608 [Rhodovulum adriaticum]